MPKTITSEEYDAKNAAIIEQYFSDISNDPIAMHHTASAWNWGVDDGDLMHIAKNKNTDLATALLIFWQSQPLDYWMDYPSIADVEESEQACFELIDVIFHNINNDFYSKGTIAYDPKDDEGADWTEDYDADNSPKKLSDVFFTKTQGQALERDDDYMEGFPSEVWQKIEALDEEFEVVD